MGLVDYSSSDSDAPRDELAPPTTRRRSASPSPSATASTLPPLPAAFHNLYATTVRPATADLPALHQGRTRVIPHVDGNWPSHIYIEWHPCPAHHDTLAALLAALSVALAPLLNNNIPTTSFLTSDLGAPLPLHISLSRPFVLRTDHKPAFRDTLASRIASAAVGPFALCVDGLAWFRSAESARSFLVLRVRTAHHHQQHETARANPQLAALLAACNEVVAAQGQPRLYAREEGVQPVEGSEGPDGAFHVSIAWSFAEPTEEMRARTAAVFAQEAWQRDVVAGIRIPVDGVKVKIGNVVTEVALAGKGAHQSSGRGQGLFGI